MALTSVQDTAFSSGDHSSSLTSIHTTPPIVILIPFVPYAFNCRGQVRHHPLQEALLGGPRLEQVPPPASLTGISVYSHTVWGGGVICICVLRLQSSGLHCTDRTALTMWLPRQHRSCHTVQLGSCLVSRWDGWAAEWKYRPFQVGGGRGADADTLEQTRSARCGVPGLLSLHRPFPLLPDHFQSLTDKPAATGPSFT